MASKNDKLVAIKLGAYTADTDETLKRDAYGFREGMSREDALKSAKGWWKLNASRAIACEYLVALAGPDNKVVAVGRIRGVLKGDTRGARCAFIADLVQDSPWYGLSVNRVKSQNPVSYIAVDSIGD